MSFAHEKRAAARLLAALEDGNLSTDDTRPLAEEADPALIYLIFSWLRARYPASHSASDGVLGRVIALCNASSVVGRKAKKGESDPIVGWFEEAYSYQEVDRDTFVSLVVEKLEG
jgi:hypothetical protein